MVGHKSVNTYSPRNIYGVGGPLGRSVDDLARGLESMLNLDIVKESDHLLARVQWDQSQLDEVYAKKDRKLKLGYYTNLTVRRVAINFDQDCQLAPSQERGLMMVVEKLREAGHEVIEIDVEETFKKLIEVFTRYLIYLIIDNVELL